MFLRSSDKPPPSTKYIMARFKYIKRKTGRSKLKYVQSHIIYIYNDSHHQKEVVTLYKYIKIHGQVCIQRTNTGIFIRFLISQFLVVNICLLL